MSGWRPASRIARRTIVRNKASSVLIVALIALPALLGTLVLVTYQTGAVTDEKAWRSNHGSADLVLSYDSAPGRESPPQTVADYQRDRQILIDALPAGASYTDDSLLSGSVTVTAGERSVVSDRSVIASTTPGMDDGIVALTRGKLPNGPSEVALAQPDIDQLGIRLGQQVTVEAGGWNDGAEPVRQSRSASVVGAVESPLRFDQKGLYYQASDGPIDPVLLQVGEYSSPESIRVQLPEGLTVEQAFPEADRLDPFAPDAGSNFRTLAPHNYAGSDGNAIDRITQRIGLGTGPLALMTVGLVVGLGCLVLLVGAVFAMVARRNRRDLLLLSLAGASPRQLSIMVVVQAVVLGVLGATVGVLLGSGAYLLLRSTLQELLRVRLDGTPVLGWPLAVVWVASLVCCVVAAWVAVRVVLSTGRQAAPGSDSRFGVGSPRLPKLAITTFSVGALGCLIGSDWSYALLSVPGIDPINGWISHGPQITNRLFTAGFFFLMIFGVVAALPALLSLIDRVARRWRLVPRLALRDAARARHRTAPTIAMVLAVTTMSISGLVLASGIDAGRGTEHIIDVPSNIVGVPTNEVFGKSATALEERRITSTVRNEFRNAREFEAEYTNTELLGACDPNPDAGQCATSPIYLADAALVAALADGQTSESQIRNHMASGGAVVFAAGGEQERSALGAYWGWRPDWLATETSARGFENSLDPRSAPTVDVPLLVLTAKERSELSGRAFASADTVARIPTGQAKAEDRSDERWAYFVLNQPLAPGQLEAVSSGLQPYGIFIVGHEPFVPVVDDFALVATIGGLPLVTLTIGIATALASTEQRSEQRLMRAIGATSLRLRQVATVQATVLALLGIGLGSIVGTVIGGSALESLGQGYPLILPLPQVTMMLVAVPAIAWLVVRRIIPKD